MEGESGEEECDEGLVRREVNVWWLRVRQRCKKNERMKEGAYHLLLPASIDNGKGMRVSLILTKLSSRSRM